MIPTSEKGQALLRLGVSICLIAALILGLMAIFNPQFFSRTQSISRQITSGEGYAATDDDSILTDKQEGELRHRKFRNKIRNMVYAAAGQDRNCLPDNHNDVYGDLRGVLNDPNFEPKSRCPKVILLDIARQVKELLTPQVPFFMGKAFSELTSAELEAIYRFIIPYY